MATALSPLPVDEIETFVGGTGRVATFEEGSRAAGWGSEVVSALSEYGALGAVERFLALEGLPIHVYRAQGEVHYQGPTEAYLSESRIEAWSGAGIIPVTAVRGQDSARITSLRSLAGTYLFADA